MDFASSKDIARQKYKSGASKQSRRGGHHGGRTSESQMIRMPDLNSNAFRQASSLLLGILYYFGLSVVHSTSLNQSRDTASALAPTPAGHWRRSYLLLVSL